MQGQHGRDTSTLVGGSLESLDQGDSEKALPALPAKTASSASVWRPRTWTRKMKLWSLIVAFLACVVLVVAVAVPVGLSKRNDGDSSNSIDGGSDNGGNSSTSTGALSPLPSISTSSSFRVSVGTAQVGRNLSTDFAGLSYEKIRLSTRLFAANNTELITLFRNLGTSILRIGGNSVDERSWNSSSDDPSGPYITPADLDSFAGFVNATGWQVIYGVPMLNTSLAAATEEAVYAAQVLGDSLYAFEIGNEPNAYTSNPLLDIPSGTSWNVSVFSEGAGNFIGWNAFAAAIQQAVPGARLTGPAAVGDSVSQWTVPFAGEQGENLSLLTHHYYRGRGNVSSATIANLLNDDSWLTKNVPLLADAANLTSGGARFTETNSYAQGGQDGVSNTYASALWAVKYLFDITRLGMSGADFHGGGSRARYSPIQDDNHGLVTNVMPLYQGILAFNKGGRGQLLAINSTGDARNSGSHVYSTRDSDGTMRATILNTNETIAVSYTINWPESAGLEGQTGRIMLLEGPSLTANNSITLGGTGAGPQGTWSPTKWYKVPVTSGQSIFALPPITGAILEYPPQS